MGPLALIPLALKAAEHVPGLVRALGGDKAGDVAEAVVGSAQRIAGVDDPEEAVHAVMRDPELMRQWIDSSKQIVIARLEAETERLRAVNETMRAESSSEDAYVRRWRPTFGYAVAASWAWFMGCAGYVLATRPPTDVAQLVTAIGGLMPLWGIALAVLGVSVHQRSKDKQVKAGQSPRPLLDGLFGTAR